MLSASSGYAEGVVDVSIVVPVCFENPLKKLAAEFLAEILALKRRAVIPVTAVLGAYHIATRYLGAPRRAVKKILTGMLETRSPALYPQVPPELAAEALDIASTYNIESWDGYLVALAQSLQARIIYTLDKELGRVKEIVAVNPFPEQEVEKYHQYLQALIKTRKQSQTKDTA